MVRLMRDSGIFGSPRKDIIIGAALLLTGFLVVVAPAIVSILAILAVLAGLAIAGVGVAVLGRQKGWWGGLNAGGAQSASSEERGLDVSGDGREPSVPSIPIKLSEGDTKTMKIAAMVVGILGSIVTFFVSVGTVVLGGLFSAFTGEGIFVAIGWLVVLSSIAALVGAILTNGNPRIGAILLGIAAVPSVLFTLSGVGLFFGLGALLLLIATVLAFIASVQESAQSA